MRRFPAFRLCAAVLLSLCCAPLVHAGTYPDHPIKMLTMTKPGAQIDLLTRAVAEKLKASLGQPVLVSNVPGGSHGSVMATELASSPADGYTLGVSATAAFTYSPHFVRTKYGLGDFQFLTLLGLNQSGIICLPDRPWKTLKEAFTWAKKEGKGLTYMFQGSDDRDAMKRIAEREGVKLSLMPSSGGPSVISAVMGGHAALGEPSHEHRAGGVVAADEVAAAHDEDVGGRRREPQPTDTSQVGGVLGHVGQVSPSPSGSGRAPCPSCRRRRARCRPGRSRRSGRPGRARPGRRGSSPRCR